MLSAWCEFDDFVCRSAGRVKSAIDMDVTSHMCTKTTFMVANLFLQVTPALILAGRRKDALKYAELTERFALTAIERGHGLVGMGARLSPDMCKRSMRYAIYLSRWFREEREDRDLLIAAMGHAEEVAKSDAAKPRVRFRKLNIAFVGGLAAKLDRLELALQYIAQSDGLINWELGGRCDEEYALLYRRVVSYLASKRKRRAERAGIVQTYGDLFARTRSGTVAMVGLENGNLESVMNLAYFGLKHFEDLREGAPFTYEGVVRSIRYAPGGDA